jgi:hypothetical protein
MGLAVVTGAMEGDSAYLPDTCLQGTNLPAHVLWAGDRPTEVVVEFPPDLELKEVYNAGPEVLGAATASTLAVKSVQVPGYLGVLFHARFLSESHKRATVRFRLTRLGTTEEFVKEVELFRPELTVVEIPESIRVDYDTTTRSYRLDRKIRLQNLGGGTAVLAISAGPGEENKIVDPSGSGEFQKRFLEDLRLKLEDLKVRWPQHSGTLDDLIHSTAVQHTFDEKDLVEIRSVSIRLERALSEDEEFLGRFVAAIVTSYMKHIQLVTELRSFMDYLNSLGQGRVMLWNALQVLRHQGGEKAVNLTLHVTDLARNKYEPIQLRTIRIACANECEIPIHLLIDWVEPKPATRRGRARG